MWRLIGITLPYYEDSTKEKQIIVSLLQSNTIEYFHIRKPDFDSKQMSLWLEDFPFEYRERLCLNDCVELASDFAIGGVHLNKRNNYTSPQNFSGRISRSCHSIAEVELYKSANDYVFLSPIFDSISKQDYQSKFSESELRHAVDNGIIDSNVFALSGIEPKKLPDLKAMGFSSAAMMGCLWQEGELRNLERSLQKWKEFIL